MLVDADGEILSWRDENLTVEAVPPTLNEWYETRLPDAVALV